MVFLRSIVIFLLLIFFAQSASSNIFEDVADGNFLLVEKYLKAGVDVNIQDAYNWTPLHEAASKGQLEIASLLIKYKADVNAKETMGKTPLHFAAYRGRDAIIKLLIKNGAKNSINKIGQTPIDLAIQEGHENTLLILKSHFLENKSIFNFITVWFKELKRWFFNLMTHIKKAYYSLVYGFEDKLHLAQAHSSAGKYQLCITVLNKIHTNVDFYKNSKELEQYCKQAYQL